MIKNTTQKMFSSTPSKDFTKISKLSQLLTEDKASLKIPPVDQLINSNLFKEEIQDLIQTESTYNLLYLPLGQKLIKNVKLSGFFLFPGSFNPVHIGHRSITNPLLLIDNFKEKDQESNILYELSVFNPDKPPIDLEALIARLSNFNSKDHPVLITKTPLFIQKLDHFWLEEPESINNFILGYDTLERLFQPRYYNEANSLENFINRLLEKNIHFYVAGRYSEKTQRYEGLKIQGEKGPANSFGVSAKTLQNLNVPQAFFEKVHPIVEMEGNEIRVDMSSTQIRHSQTGSCN